MKFVWTVLSVIVVIGLMVIFLPTGHKLQAQNNALTPSILTMPSTAVAANCPVPIVATTIYCFGADKLEVSANGGAYVVIWPSPAVAPAGLTGVTYNGVAAPVSGGVAAITGPTKAVLPASVPLQ
jgi:hypothetical protein